MTRSCSGHHCKKGPGLAQLCSPWQELAGAGHITVTEGKTGTKGGISFKACPWWPTTSYLAPNVPQPPETAPPSEGRGHFMFKPQQGIASGSSGIAVGHVEAQPQRQIRETH